MPYLQLDVNGHYSTEDKRRLAARMSETYAEMMSVDIRRTASLFANWGTAASGGSSRPGPNLCRYPS